MKVQVRNNLTQLQVLTMKSGEILTLPSRGTRTIDADEISADIEIKVTRKMVAIVAVPADFES